MAPATEIPDFKKYEQLADKLPSEIGTDPDYHPKIVWRNVFIFTNTHLLALWGIYLTFTEAKWWTIIYTYFVCIYLIGGIGTNIGAHRLYSHKAFKAKFLFRLIVVLCNSFTGQNSMYWWVRDHRLHHKYTDTDADPHNAERGFFFCHIGWILSKKHPLVSIKGRKIDMSDIEKDWLVMFQKRHFFKIYIPMILASVIIPVYFWNESIKNSIIICYFTRYMVHLNFTFFVNSWAHFYGSKPYDKNISPVENVIVSALSCGEGWHNFHHVWPSDYRTSEMGFQYSLVTGLIDVAAFFGLAYDLKTTSAESVKKRLLKNEKAKD